MTIYDKIWIYSCFFAIWNHLRYLDTGSDLRMSMAITFSLIGSIVFIYSIWKD